MLNSSVVSMETMGSLADSPAALGPRSLHRIDLSCLRTCPGCREVPDSFVGDRTFRSVNQDTQGALVHLQHQLRESEHRMRLLQPEI